MVHSLRTREMENGNDELMDENGVVHTTARSMKKVNYSEIENGNMDIFDENEEIPGGDEDANEAEDYATKSPSSNENINEDQDPEFSPSKTTTRGGKKSNYNKANEDDDDESFNEDDVEDNDADDVDDTNSDDDYEYSTARSRSKRGRKGRAPGRNNTYNQKREIDAFIVKDESDFDDDEEEEITYSNSRRRGKKPRNNYTQNNYNDYNDEEDDQNIRRSRRLRSTSMQNDDAPFLRRRTRSSVHATENVDNNYAATNHIHDGSELTLQDEIRELRESSPIREFKGEVSGIEKGPRSLRERTKHVNYKIPPPLLDPAQVSVNNEYYNNEDYRSAASALGGSNTLRNMNTASPSRRGRGTAANKFPQRRLFPTGGPFGGNDVTSIFGQNTVFYNLEDDVNLTSLPKFNATNKMEKPSGLNLIADGIIGTNPPTNDLNGNSAQNNNKRLIDSDSSEDEILPMGATPKTKDPNAKKKKKKPEIADLDPLGVDMNISFDDVGGLDNYIDQLKEMITLPLLYPELYQNFNITPPRGVLFHGPPGTGKTLMARALAASCSSETRKITFFMRKGADILSKWVGEAERQLRLLFEEAKKHQPSIIFFDEIDGLAPVRSSKQEQIHASIVSTMLALMDGMDNRGQVIVIGATNRPDAVDPALRRPGRFDREFYFPLPDVDSRAKILEIHTRKWNPPIAKDIIKQLANLTKGYGGADLRALCTESALISIQHKYPQIYRSNDKLAVDVSKIKVGISDFMLALEKIIPSSARAAGTTAQPLPDSVRPLLNNQLEAIKSTLNQLIPVNDNQFDRSKSLIQQFIDYEDFDDNELSEQNVLSFEKHSLINRIMKSRVSKPRLLISGPHGNGQQYIGAAILNLLEHYNVQKLDIATLVSDSSRTIESAVVQAFIEARKRQPAVIYIPNLDLWFRTVPENVILTLATLLGSLQNNEKLLLLGIGENLNHNLMDKTSLSSLGFSSNICEVSLPNSEQRSHFFESIEHLICMKPSSFNLRKKRTKPLPELPLASPESDPNNLDENGTLLSPQDILKRKLKKFQYQDMRLKNILKIKLSGIMDLILKRYRRFKKPAVDDSFLIHLFEPITNDPNWEPSYVKDNDMILEVATGKKFYNMDLDIVEERLWNGFYSDPRQFLRDIEYIYHDASVLGDRENTIRASEMFANAQMAIEDISTKEFIEECRATHQRDLERQKLFLQEEQLKLVAQQKKNEEDIQIAEKNIAENNIVGNPITTNIIEVGVGAGNQLQSQAQIDNNLSMATNEELNIQEVNVPVGETVDAKQSSVNITSNLSNNDVKHEILDSSSALPTGQPVNSIDNNNNVENTSKDVSINEVPAPSGQPKQQEVSEETIAATSEETFQIVEKEEDSRSVIVDESDLKIIVKDLTARSEDFTVSELEELYAQVVNIAWDDRGQWDKSLTISKIKQFLNI